MILLLLFLTACTKTVAECSETVSCEFGSTCVEGKCESQSCATSDQCGIEQYCSDHECVAGCAEDNDCMFGDLCDVDAKTCVVSECTDTQLDCQFGEFCSGDGSCYEAGGYYCKPCQGDGDCGGGGNICLNGTCGVTCDDANDCPRGFQCYPVTDGSGNVVTNQCWTDCSLYGDGG